MADEVFEFFIEFFVEGAVNIALSIIPENKHSKKTEKVFKFTAVFITILFLILFVVGVCMVGETGGRSILGKIFMCLTPLQFSVSLVLYIIKKIKEKVKK